MTLSKAARRILASIVAVMVLLCQSTALVHACAGAAQPAAAVAHPPCHDSGGNDAQGPAHDGHQTPCLSQATSSSPALPDIPLLAGLPALVVHAATPGIGAYGLPVAEPPPLRGEPPPLTILHCCLRN